MKYYIDSKNQLFAFESDGSQDSLITEDMRPATDAEVAAVQNPQPSLDEARGFAIRKIDADVDAMYGAVIGNRQAEYDLAEHDAQAYKAAGYSGTVPSSVQSWAAAKQWTAKQAADDILATSVSWRAAQADIRANRLTKKEAVRAAATHADLDAAMIAWASFFIATKTQLGI